MLSGEGLFSFSINNRANFIGGNKKIKNKKKNKKERERERERKREKGSFPRFLFFKYMRNLFSFSSSNLKVSN